MSPFPSGQVTFLNPDFSVNQAWLHPSVIGNTHLYTGRERDPEYGLQLNRHRYYAPHLGRWLTRDPIRYRGGMNLYWYVLSNPVYWLDPLGLDVWLQTHPVSGGNHHLSLLIIPDNQGAWADNPNFAQLPDGQWYTTIGAGPTGTIPGWLGNLEAGYLRPTDNETGTLTDDEIAENPRRDRCNLNAPVDANGNPINEDEWIDQLLQAADNYGNDLPYALFPDRHPGHFNSNSFIGGLLDFTGTPRPSLGTEFDDSGDWRINRPWQWPGWNRPVPPESFQPRP